MKDPQYDKDIISSLKINSKISLINVLVYFADKDSITEYKNGLPFVNVFEEIYEQWKSLFLIKKRWFKETFTKSELLQLTEFDNTINIFYKSKNVDIDFSEIISSKEWIEISQLAEKILKNNNW